MPDFVLSVRDVNQRQEFVNEPGRARFLAVPGNRIPQPSHEIPAAEWVARVTQAASYAIDPRTNQPLGDLLIFIHGYNNSTAAAVRRLRQLKQSLQAVGYQGAVASFDWPSDTAAITYLEDRADAKQSALLLVSEGITRLAQAQQADCQINVHLLAYSMGAFVVREAFDDADDRRRIAAINWTVSQLCLVAADISSASLSADNAKSASLYRHALRVTNYYNPYDPILRLSNVKRVGVAPRAGRVGLPLAAPAKAVDVDCGPYFRTLADVRNGYANEGAHSFYIDNRLFAQDLLYTLRGEIAARHIPTRVLQEGRLALWPLKEGGA